MKQAVREKMHTLYTCIHELRHISLSTALFEQIFDVIFLVFVISFYFITTIN